MSELVEYRRLRSSNPLLGRNIEKDARSLAYRPQLLEEEDFESIRHHVNIGVLNQAVGCCTAGNQINMIASDQIWKTLTDQQKAVILADPNEAMLDWYREITRTDEFALAWEPDDTGSSGTSASKTTVRRGFSRGFINGYNLRESFAMFQNGTIGIGSWWYSSFNRPARDGRVTITPDAYKQGGHQYTGIELDFENGRVVMLNTWNYDWGVDGEFWYDFETFDRLLLEDGDLVQLVPDNQPPPEPDWDLMLAEHLRPWAVQSSWQRIVNPGKASRAAAASREWLARKAL
jgi:hypothetical protein